MLYLITLSIFKIEKKLKQIIVVKTFSLNVVSVCMKHIYILLSLLLIFNCSQQNTKYASNNLETSSIVTVKPKVINESAFENFYMSENLEKELKKIEFTSTSYLRSNKDCIGIVRLSVSGSIDYYQLINTLKKRAYDIGGNAIGIYDYEEKRRVYVNQQGYKIETDNIFRPKTKYVLVKENQKVSKITADIFKCRKST